MGRNSMEELLRSRIVSCGDEFAVLFFKELFENINAETETGESPSKDSKLKTDATEPQTEPSRKRSSIVMLDGEEIEEF